jgi:hypothetical protein
VTKLVTFRRGRTRRDFGIPARIGRTPLDLFPPAVLMVVDDRGRRARGNQQSEKHHGEEMHRVPTAQ